MNNKKTFNHSSIVSAIRDTEALTTSEIHVHLTRKWLERDPLARAKHLFHQYALDRHPEENAILIYVNFRRRRFAIHGGKAVHRALGEAFWEKLAQDLKRNLIGTHPENAIALTIRKLGVHLALLFPREGAFDSSLDPESEVTEDE